MKQHKRLTVFILPLIFLSSMIVTSCDRNHEDEANQEAVAYNHHEEAIIRERVEEYVDAMNRRDIDTLVDFWSDEAIYRNHLTGELVQGKENIKAEYRSIFEELQDAKIDIEIESIHFPFEDKAVEEGVARIIIPGRTIIETEYKMIYVKRDDQWKILNVNKLELGELGPPEE